MRAFGLELRAPMRRYAPEPADPGGPPPRPSGSDGLTRFGYMGVFDDVPELQGRLRFLVFDEMRKSDAAVRSVLWLYKLLARSATYSLEEPGTDELDKVVRQAIAENFGLEGHPGWLDLTWDEGLAQDLLMLDYGSMFEEIVFGDILAWTPPDGGTPRILRPIARLAPRYPHTIPPENFRSDPRTGKLVSVLQDLPDVQPIPGENLVAHVLEREGNDWYGTSLLRPMYGPWMLKKTLLVLVALGWDRHASGIPIVRYPQGRHNEKTEAESIGRNWRSHEYAWVVLEGTREQGWDVEVKGGEPPNDATPLLHYYDGQISKAGLAQFADLGTTQRGSRAVGDVLSDAFYLAVQAIADGIADRRQLGPFRRFVDVNFGTEIAVPNLTVSKIRPRNVELLVEAIPALSAAGFHLTDPDTQDDVREALDLRALSPELREALEAVLGAGAGIGVAREGDDLEPLLAAA